MIEINIKLEEEARILEAFGVGSSKQIRERLIDYLNTVVNDYERNTEISKVITAYSFIPLIEIVDEPVGGSDEPPIEEPPIGEDPTDEGSDEPPVEDPEEPIE